MLRVPERDDGRTLHGQNPGGYSLVNGRHQCEQVNVAWALHDEVEGFGANSGGFVCVPGSHKALYQIPRPLHTGIDLPQVYKPGLKAGDVPCRLGTAHGDPVHGVGQCQGATRRQSGRLALEHVAAESEKKTSRTVND